jgi:DNA polymerase III subunit alpha
MQQRFVHLRTHTEFSLVDGLVRIKPLMKALPTLGMSAIAVTDHCNLFAAVKVYQAAIGAGIKPIIGSELPVQDAKDPSTVFPLVLLCMNDTGYTNLTRIISKAYQEGQYQGKPRVQYEWIKDCSEGLIALSGGRLGDIGQALLANHEDLARERARFWMQCFPGRFYLELSRTGRADEAAYNSQLVQLADALALPLVATNDVRFIEQDDFDAHEARVCIHEGYSLADPRRKAQYSAQQYLRSSQEMESLFADLPSAIQNTVEISKRCSLILNLGTSCLPKFPTPDGSSIEDYLSQRSKEGLSERIEYLFRHKTQEERIALRPAYDNRLALEIDVINSMGFAGYFLIVADFIQWAKNNGVPVGPGRGSGAGSLVAYVLHITDLDPLEYELLFERFLNPERVSMPDFDIDFCMEGRDRVIDYVATKYGRHCVSQIITFGTMAAKAVVRDVGRVLGHPYGFVDKLAKLIPFELGITLIKAMELEPELKRRYDNEDEVKELIDLALKLEGITRNAGKHAGGVVIAPSCLTDFTAIYCEEGSTQIVSQFDKDDVEAVGLVKFDFLGLRTLTIIDWALAAINQTRAALGLDSIDIGKIPTDSPEPFALLKACKTTAVFQLESRGMKELINRLQPDCFEEIIALVALFRPGPLQSGMVDDFIDRKHGRQQVEYPHPDLEPILKPTYGVILYQEQVMQIAQVLANYTLGAADLLRRAMGKKKPEEMAQQREIFTIGATARGVDPQVATHIFDLMEKFAGYGFNKSHSAAYALVAYQTAWLKAHYPAAFMAAVLSSDMDNTDKVVTFIDECKHMKLTVLPPSINQSLYAFSAHNEDTIIYGLGAIKGAGQSAIESIVTERTNHGTYTDLFSFCKRLDMRKVNRRVLEPLIKSGSFDEWGIDRAVLTNSLDKALKMAEQNCQKLSTGQFDLFSLLDDTDTIVAYVTGKSWPLAMRLQGEREVLGYYLTGHPATQYRHELGDIIVCISQLDPLVQKKALICGQVSGMRQIITKRGKKLLIIGMDDGTARMDVVVFQEIYEAFGETVASGGMVVIEGEIARDDYNGGVKMTAKQLYTMAGMRIQFARCLELRIKPDNQPVLSTIKAILKAHPGQCMVQLNYMNDAAKACLNLDKSWSVSPHDSMLQALSEVLGDEQVIMNY